MTTNEPPTELELWTTAHWINVNQQKTQQAATIIRVGNITPPTTPGEWMLLGITIDTPIGAIAGIDMRTDGGLDPR